MAGSVTRTEVTHRSVKLVKLAWTSDAAGAVNGTATVEAYSGRIIYAAFVPGTAGDQPTDQYDVTVLDNNSLDVLAGAGSNLSNAAAVYKTEANLGAVAESTLTLTITNAGNAKTGTVYLYIR